MNYPTKEQAHKILDEGLALNPGEWGNHCIVAARCAEKIAEKCGMDASRAYVNSLLHDTGRRFGRTGRRHTVDGYKYLSLLGYDHAARICLTHSFVLARLDEMLGVDDFTDDERRFMADYLDSVKYDEYDRLGQLCDYLAFPTGACIAEKRMVDVALRYGVNDLAIERWKKVFEIKAGFDDMAGCDIYTLIM